ncbi:hypothetical protein AB9M75_04325 [Lactobacillus sp. AN1001]
MDLSHVFDIDKVEFTKNELEAPYEDREYYIILANGRPSGCYSTKQDALLYYNMAGPLIPPVLKDGCKLELVKVKVAEVLKSTNFVMGR